MRTPGRWQKHGSWLLRWGGLALCATILMMWLASGWFALQATYGSPSCGAFLRIGRGRLSILAGDQGALGMSMSAGVHAGVGRGPPPGWDWGWHAKRSRGKRGLLVVAPLYAPFLMLGVPVGWMFYTHRRGRPRPGHCPACAYDLSGMPASEHTTCPECGGRIVQPTR